MSDRLKYRLYLCACAVAGFLVVLFGFWLCGLDMTTRGPSLAVAYAYGLAGGVIGVLLSKGARL